MKFFVALVSLVLLHHQAESYTLYNNQQYYSATPLSRSPQQCQPLAAPVLLLAERACGSPGSLSEMPLVVVAEDSLHVVRDGLAQVRVSAFNAQTPFATVSGPSIQQGEALRAVRVELQRPVLLTSLRSTLPFPDSFIVVHGADGAASPLAIRTVVAPVPAGTTLSPSRPIAVHVLYALPLDPFNAPPAPQPISHRRPAYDYYANNFYSDAPYYTPSPQYLGYGYEDHQHLAPQPQYQIHFQQRPQYQGYHFRPQTQAVHHQGPQQVPQGDGIKKPGANLVTILEFPSSVATPESLFYQPEDPDSELGNRQPPQAVSPAGIVQSTQPQPNLSVFVNSKESAVLQSLRDEAEKEKAARNRLAASGLRVLQHQESVEGDSVIVDALRQTRSSSKPKEQVEKSTDDQAQASAESQ